MRIELRRLIELQGVDTTMGRMALQKKELPERLARLEQGWRDALTEAQTCREQRDASERRHRDLEEGLKRGAEQLRRARERLLEVKTNREYQAMLKEMEVLEAKNGELEDAILLLLEELDALRKEADRQDAFLEEHRRRFEGERRQIETELAGIDASQARLQQQGEDLRRTLEKDLLKKYENIRSLNKGLAVVPAWNEVCGGCHMNVPPQFYNQLMRSEDLCFCPHCSRILYCKNPEPAPGSEAP